MRLRIEYDDVILKVLNIMSGSRTYYLESTAFVTSPIYFTLPEIKKIRLNDFSIKCYLYWNTIIFFSDGSVSLLMKYSFEFNILTLSFPAIKKSTGSIENLIASVL